MVRAVVLDKLQVANSGEGNCEAVSLSHLVGRDKGGENEDKGAA